MIVRPVARSVRAAIMGPLLLTLAAAGCSSSGGGGGTDTAVPPAAKGRFTPVKPPTSGPRKGVPSPVRGR